jgi:hypothetical protein
VQLSPRYELLCARNLWKRTATWLLLRSERESFLTGTPSCFWQSSVSRAVLYFGTGLKAL